MFLLFKEWSPETLIQIFGVVERIPNNSLAKVPEFPKFMLAFFFA